jgi:DNA topoisomerase-1
MEELEGAIVTDPVEAARAAHLRYVSDAKPGITRERSGDGWIYRGPGGDVVDDPAELARIRSLAIPPAWTDVWICPRPNGHLQATGRDAKGRKQYRYHPRWRRTRDETKYGRMIIFGMALPSIRERVEEDLGLPGLPREKVLATVVRLMERTLIRVGNEEYARANGSFGITTMRNRHVKVEGAKLRFSFIGKSGIRHHIDVSDRRLARIVARCRDLPGQDLFQYLDDAGTQHAIGSEDVNDYLRTISGHDFTAKDFRTWSGTVIAASILGRCGECATDGERKKNLMAAVNATARKLGNTPAVCRKCYIHPAILDAYLDGSLGEFFVDASSSLADDEARVLDLLRRGAGG